MVDFNEFGPEKIVEVYNPKVGMHGFVVIDSTALGPAKGGIRMTATVSKDEVARLARTMTWKCSLAGLPFGGGKGGIIANPREFNNKKKQEIVAAFSKALKIICPELYVSAPDINTAEEEMSTFAKANGSRKSCTGKPKRMGGIPHELGSTGFGVFHSTVIAAKHLKWNLKDKTFAVEGFGNVGWFVSKFMTKAGAKLVAVSDSKGCLFNKDGIDFKKLAKVKKEKGSVTKYGSGKVNACENIIRAPVDILITAAIPDLINKKNVRSVKAKLVVEGSNIAMTYDVEKILHKRGILVIPDFVANAGGVISSYVEYIGGNEKKMFKMVENKIKRNTQAVLNKISRTKIPRQAALEIAQKRVGKKCKICAV